MNGTEIKRTDMLPLLLSWIECLSTFLSVYSIPHISHNGTGIIKNYSWLIKKTITTLLQLLLKSK